MRQMTTFKKKIRSQMEQILPFMNSTAAQKIVFKKIVTLHISCFARKPVFKVFSSCEDTDQSLGLFSLTEVINEEAQ